MEKEINNIWFDPQEGMCLSNWLEYFEDKCDQFELDDKWNFNNILKYFKGKALTEYVNYCLNINQWINLTDTLQEIFFKTDNVVFSEFTNLKFKDGDDLDSYFHQKIKIGEKLGLSRNIIIVGLTEGLSSN